MNRSIKYKWSKYNYSQKDGDNTVLYNCGSDKMLVLLPEIAQLIEEHKESPILIKDIHPELFAALLEMKFLVEEPVNEAESVISHWQWKHAHSDEYAITINPTLDCNCRCWYCYEEHCKDMNMRQDTLDAIKHLVERKVREPQLRQLGLSFFGGEPLMKFHEIVLPILNHAKSLCEKEQKNLSVRFTTNGVLLSEHIIQELSQFPHVFLQITLDGNKEAHDQVRHVASGKGTFDIIIDHIRKALKAGFELNVRFNYTQKNVDTFADVFQEFEELSADERYRTLFDFQPVWQEREDNRTSKRVAFLTSCFEGAGLRVAAEKSLHSDFCYADRENCIVVNYDGLLYKCTARSFSPQACDGKLLPDGTLQWNEQYRQRMSIKFGTAQC